MKVSLGYDSNVIHCASNGLGINFSSSQYNATNTPPINNWALIFSNSVLTDTLNWVTISGEFVADSTYNYLIVGNFFNDSSIIVQSINGNPFCGLVYYYIDEVCVSVDSTVCEISSSVNSNKKLDFSIYPNPCCQYFYISKVSSINYYNMIIYDLFGNKIYVQNDINDLIHKVDLLKYPAGAYFLQIQFLDTFSSYKLLKI